MSKRHILTAEERIDNQPARIVFRMPIELKAFIQRQANECDVSMNQFLINLVLNHKDRLLHQQQIAADHKAIQERKALDGKIPETAKLP